MICWIAVRFKYDFASLHKASLQNSENPHFLELERMSGTTINFPTLFLTYNNALHWNKCFQQQRCTEQWTFSFSIHSGSWAGVSRKHGRLSLISSRRLTGFYFLGCLAQTMKAKVQSLQKHFVFISQIIWKKAVTQVGLTARIKEYTAVCVKR